MSRTIEIAEDQQVEEQAAPLAETQAILWGEVMRAVGYPESWREEVTAGLAVEGRTFSWKKVIDADGN